MTATDLMLREPAVQAVGWALLHFLWQGSLIAVVAAIALRVLRHSAADVRYVVAAIALTLMATMPVVTGVQAWRSATAATAVFADESTAGVSVTAPDPIAAPAVPAMDIDLAGADSGRLPAAAGVVPRERWLAFFVLAWMAGVGILALRLVGGWIWLKRVAFRGARPGDARLQAIVRRLSRRLHISRPVRLLQSARVEVPTVIGWLRPTVLLPISALSGLSPLQIEAILAHELAHIRRHDYLVNLLQTLLETLLFYHPAVWWLSRRIRSERENCCDDLAVSLCGDPVTYARALADLEELRGASARLALAASGGSLLTRVRRLLATPTTHAGRGPAWLAASAAVMLMLGIVASAVDRPLPSQPVTPPHETHATAADGAVVPHAPKRLHDVQATRPAEGGWIVELFSRDRLRLAMARVRDVFWGGDVVQDPPPVPPAPPSQAAPPPPPPPPAPRADARENVAQPPVPATPPAPARPGVAPSPMPALAPAPAPMPPPPVDAPQPAAPTPPPMPRRAPAPALSPAPMPAPAPGASPMSRAPEATPAPPPPPSVPMPPPRHASAAAPAPPAVPAPPAAHQGSTRQSSGTYSWSNNGERLEVKYNGTFEVNDDDTDITRMSPNGHLMISDGKWLRSRSVEFKADAAGVITRRFYVGSREVPFEPEGRAWLTTILPRFVRASGIAAPARVQRFLKRGGVDAVLTEISLIPGSYGKKVYFVELVRVAQIDPAAARRILAQAGREVDSDYELATLLIESADKLLLDDATAGAYFDAVRAIESDYEMKRTLNAALRRASLAPGVVGRVLESVAAIESDYEAASLLLDVAKSHGVGAAMRAPFFKAVTTIESSYEKSRVLQALLRRGELDPETLSAVLEAAATIDGYESGQVLQTAARTQGITGRARDLYVKAAGRLGDYDESQALAALVRSERRE